VLLLHSAELPEGFIGSAPHPLSRRVAIDSLLLMIGTSFIGAFVLNFLAVSRPVVQVGGGLAVISMAWEMLVESGRSRCSRSKSGTIIRVRGSNGDMLNQERA